MTRGERGALTRTRSSVAGTVRRLNSKDDRRRGGSVADDERGAQAEYDGDTGLRELLTQAAQRHDAIAGYWRRTPKPGRLNLCAWATSRHTSASNPSPGSAKAVTPEHPTEEPPLHTWTWPCRLFASLWNEFQIGT